MKLATRISLTLTGVLLLAVLSSAVALLSARHIGHLMQDMVTENLSSVLAAEELEIALLDQKGFVSSYILDSGNRTWLEELSRKTRDFNSWLDRARETAHTPEEHEIIDRVEEVYRQYLAKRGEVIALYEKGEVEEAKTVLLRDMNALYNRAYVLCEDFISANQRYIKTRIADGRGQIRRNTLIVGICVSLTAALGIGLLYFFFRVVLLPLRKMAEDARVFSAGGLRPAQGGSPSDELQIVGLYLRTLMSDVQETRTSLERSRSQLMQAENLASVGKLAASVAHEIRNPLTSLKMRLFSIRKNVADGHPVDENFRVVSDEITRLESIIRNFLEFSRPPELNLRSHDVSTLIDKALELVGHRLVERDVRLARAYEKSLPCVVADADQMKQVFINLIGNAAEAVEEGGEVRILTALERDGGRRPMVVVRVQDDGIGVAEDIRDRIIEPFFSTKENGTGLGLCIAAQIMARHGGRLDLEGSADRGATFSVRIPTANGKDDGQNSGG